MAAAPLTDAALTRYRTITRALPHVPPDYPALVIGCGALGQFGVKILRLLSGADIIAVDLDDGKLKARESGARHTINARDPEVGQKVSVSVSWWGKIRDLREVLALAESGRLTPIPLEFWPLVKINDVYERVKHGQVAGRAVITP